MAHILITGMTAPQASPNANARTQSYAGQIAALLVAQGHTVVWRAEKIDTLHRDFELFDAIFIGIAPILGLSSNFSYGALHIIDYFFNDPRTIFFIDAPLPSQIFASLRALAKDKKQLIKPFFRARPGYDLLASDNLEAVGSVLGGLEKLTTQKWPTTLYPRLPWESTPPEGFTNLIGLNLDAVYAPSVGDYKRKRYSHWVADSPSSPWVKKVEQSLAYGVAPMRGTKFAKDAQVQHLMSTMLGSLIAPQRDKMTWWSPRYVQSLQVGTPVATEWREAGGLSADWAVLPAAIEDMSAIERFNLAERQLSTYLTAIPTNEESFNAISAIMSIYP